MKLYKAGQSRRCNGDKSQGVSRNMKHNIKNYPDSSTGIDNAVIEDKTNDFIHDLSDEYNKYWQTHQYLLYLQIV